TGTRRGASGSTWPSTRSWYSSTVITAVPSVDRQARVDVGHPRADAAVEVGDVGVPGPAQDALGLRRAPARQAVDDDGAARLDPRRGGRERVGDEPFERDGHRTGDLDDGPLGRLADVEEDEVVLPALAGGEPCGQVPGAERGAGLVGG